MLGVLAGHLFRQVAVLDIPLLLQSAELVDVATRGIAAQDKIIDDVASRIGRWIHCKLLWMNLARHGAIGCGSCRLWLHLRILLHDAHVHGIATSSATILAML